MGDTLTLKWAKADDDLKAWAESQPEGATAALARAALLALREQRSTGRGKRAVVPAPSGSPEWMPALLDAIEHIPGAVKAGVLEALQGEPSIAVWQNGQTPVDETYRAKRPTRNGNHKVVEAEPPDDTAAVDAAAANFLRAFG